MLRSERNGDKSINSQFHRKKIDTKHTQIGDIINRRLHLFTSQHVVYILAVSIYFYSATTQKNNWLREI